MSRHLARGALLVSLILSAISLPALAKRPAGGPWMIEVEDDSPVVAVYAGGTVTQAEVEAFLISLNERQRERFRSPAGRQDMLERLVLVEVMADLALAEGIGRTERDQLAMIQAMQAHLFERLLTERRAQAHSPEATRAYYDEHIDDYQQEQVSARHILLKDKNACWSAYHRLMAGEDFAELAEEVSEDRASKAKGGDLGWFRRGRMVAEFEDASFGLAVGAVSEPLETRFGFHLIKVEGRRTVIPFEEAESRIRTTLERGTVSGFVDDVEASLGVVLDEEALAAIDLDEL